MLKAKVRVTLEVTETFPDSWSDNEIEKYIEDRIDEYDSEIVDTEIYELDEIENDGQDYDEWRDLNE